jgi:hypothetical protein
MVRQEEKGNLTRQAVVMGEQVVEVLSPMALKMFQ